MLQFHTAGYITAGDMRSFYVKIVPDPEDTGGYYLLFSKDFHDPHAERGAPAGILL